MKTKIRPRCFFDIDIGHSPAGRVIFELYDDICPKTTANFEKLCTGEQVNSDGVKLHYMGSSFHRVIKGFMIQGGDFMNNDGTGGESIYGGRFEDENFTIPHDKPFLLSMANCGPNTNGSQFFITTKTTPHLNGKHVVFGHVVSGDNLIESIENLPVNENKKPVVEATIKNCGKLVAVLKNKIKKKKEKQEQSDNSESSSKDKKRKKKKIKKKNKKKIKLAKKIKTEDINPQCSVRPDEIPEVPKPYYLFRGNLKEELKQTDKPKEEPILANEEFDENAGKWNENETERKVDHAGRTTKGRGAMRYRPSPTDLDGTPPHWYQDEQRPKATIKKEASTERVHHNSKRHFPSSDDEDNDDQKMKSLQPKRPKAQEPIINDHKTKKLPETFEDQNNQNSKSKSLNKFEQDKKEKSISKRDEDTKKPIDLNENNASERISNEKIRNKNIIYPYKDNENVNNSKKNDETTKKIVSDDYSENNNEKKENEDAIKKIEYNQNNQKDFKMKPKIRTHSRSRSRPWSRSRSRSRSGSRNRYNNRNNRRSRSSSKRYYTSSQNKQQQKQIQKTKSPPAYLVERWKNRRQQFRGRRRSSHDLQDRNYRRSSSRRQYRRRSRSSRNSRNVPIRRRRSSGTVDSSVSSSGSSKINKAANQNEQNKIEQIDLPNIPKPPEPKEASPKQQVTNPQPVLVLKPKEKPWLQNQWKDEDPEEEAAKASSVLEKLKREEAEKDQKKQNMISTEAVNKNEDVNKLKNTNSAVTTKQGATVAASSPPISQSISKFRSPSGTRSSSSASSRSSSSSGRPRRGAPGYRSGGGGVNTAGVYRKSFHSSDRSDDSRRRIRRSRSYKRYKRSRSRDYTSRTRSRGKRGSYSGSYSRSSSRSSEDSGKRYRRSRR